MLYLPVQFQKVQISVC